MKFKTLSIANFLAIGTASISLADRGLMLIQGLNNDNSSSSSNGSGKSSIGDAISWCLYGETGRGISGDDVINDVAKKNTCVAIVAEDNTETYEISRHRKHKTHKNALRVVIKNTDGTETDLTKGTDKLTQEVVNTIIGCSYQVFTAAIYAAQENMPNFPGMTDKELKLLIEEAAGTDVLEAGHRLAVLEARETAQAHAASHAKAQTLAEAMVDLVNDKTNRLAQQAQWQSDNYKAYGVLTGSIAAYGPKMKEIQDKLATIPITDLDLKIAELQQEIDDYKTNENALIGLRATERNLESKKNNGDYKLADIKLEITRLSGELANIKAGVVPESCTQCGQALDNDAMSHMIGHIESQIVIQKSNLARTAAEVTAAIKDFADARDIRKKAEAAAPDVSSAFTDLKALQDHRYAFSKLKSEETTIKSKARSLFEEAKRLKATPNPYDCLIAENAKKTADYAALTAAEEKRCIALKEKADALAIVAKVFSPGGVRARILDEVTPYLNDQTAKYLGTLTDGNTTATWSTLTPTVKGELKEKFSIDVQDVTGGSCFKALSGGEKRKVRIATALAVQDLVARRAIKPIDLFIGDEIDDALDPAGQERLMGVLEEKAKERGTVLMISHSDLKDWISQTIMVRKTGKVSTVTEELS